jgi:hypothetical protein
MYTWWLAIICNDDGTYALALPVWARTEREAYEKTRTNDDETQIVVEVWGPFSESPTSTPEWRLGGG